MRYYTPNKWSLESDKYSYWKMFASSNFQLSIQSSFQSTFIHGLILYERQQMNKEY